MKKSAGIMVYRFISGQLEIFLVHPGGPYFKNKDNGAWSIPKGEIGTEEEPLNAAIREFQEETGFKIEGELLSLDPVKQKGGKTVYGWAMQGEIEPCDIKSNYFSIEWPPRSGRQQQFPEIDRAAWFSIDEAKIKILDGQMPMLNQLSQILMKKEG